MVELETALLSLLVSQNPSSITRETKEVGVIYIYICIFLAKLKIGRLSSRELTHLGQHHVRYGRLTLAVVQPSGQWRPGENVGASQSPGG